MPDNPFWYKHNNPYYNIGAATVADSVGDTFQPRYGPKQAPLGMSQRRVAILNNVMKLNSEINKRIINRISKKLYRTTCRMRDDNVLAGG
jgi:hypothetical protein